MLFAACPKDQMFSGPKVIVDQNGGHFLRAICCNKVLRWAEFLRTRKMCLKWSEMPGIFRIGGVKSWSVWNIVHNEQWIQFKKETWCNSVGPSHFHDWIIQDLDFIVIGSGMGGLWLAAALTKCGYKVLVLEQCLGKTWEKHRKSQSMEKPSCDDVDVSWCILSNITYIWKMHGSSSKMFLWEIHLTNGRLSISMIHGC